MNCFRYEINIKRKKGISATYRFGVDDASEGRHVSKEKSSPIHGDVILKLRAIQELYTYGLELALPNIDQNVDDTHYYQGILCN